MRSTMKLPAVIRLDALRKDMLDGKHDLCYRSFPKGLGEILQTIALSPCLRPQHRAARTRTGDPWSIAVLVPRSPRRCKGRHQNHCPSIFHRLSCFTHSELDRMVRQPAFSKIQCKLAISSIASPSCRFRSQLCTRLDVRVQRPNERCREALATARGPTESWARPGRREPHPTFAKNGSARTRSTLRTARGPAAGATTTTGMAATAAPPRLPRPGACDAMARSMSSRSPNHRRSKRNHRVVSTCRPRSSQSGVTQDSRISECLRTRRKSWRSRWSRYANPASAPSS